MIDPKHSRTHLPLVQWRRILGAFSRSVGYRVTLGGATWIYLTCFNTLFIARVSEIAWRVSTASYNPESSAPVLAPAPILPACKSYSQFSGRT